MTVAWAEQRIHFREAPQFAAVALRQMLTCKREGSAGEAPRVATRGCSLEALSASTDPVQSKAADVWKS